MTLDETLESVGPLDDSPGENTTRDRFRTHRAKSVSTPGALPDYVETFRNATAVRSIGVNDERATCPRAPGLPRA